MINGVRVQDIRAGEVVLPDGVIRAGTIVWAAASAHHRWRGPWGWRRIGAARLPVGPDLRLRGRPEAFAIGDVAAVTDRNGVEVPGVAQGALQMGRHVARLIATEVKGGPRAAGEREAFVYHDKGSMATIGRSSAVAQIGSHHFSGWTAWVAWLGVHLLFLIGFRNKVSVLLSWAYSYFTYKRGARIITGGDRCRPAGSQNPEAGGPR